MDKHHWQNINEEAMAQIELKYHNERRQLLVPDGEDTMVV
jgi:hypothetical protein